MLRPHPECDLVGDKQPPATEPSALPDSVHICFTLKKIWVLSGIHRCLLVLLTLFYILKIVVQTGTRSSGTETRGPLGVLPPRPMMAPGGRTPSGPLVSVPLDLVPVESSSIFQPSGPLPQKQQQRPSSRAEEPPRTESSPHVSVFT